MSNVITTLNQAEKKCLESLLKDLVAVALVDDADVGEVVTAVSHRLIRRFFDRSEELDEIVDEATHRADLLVLAYQRVEKLGDSTAAWQTWEATGVIPEPFGAAFSAETEAFQALREYVEDVALPFVNAITVAPRRKKPAPVAALAA